MIVRAIDLDTDERTSTELDVEAPRDPALQRTQFVTIVGRLHPTARIRSFGNGAASFLSKDHLVVAHYDASLPPARPLRPGDDSARLFPT